MSRRWIWLAVFVFAASGGVPALRAQLQPGGLVSAMPPAYPLAAKAAGIEGKVVLKAVIGEDGKVRDVVPVKGPEELRQAAVDVVQRWTYRPYLRNGVPTSVNTTVNVLFTLGNRKEKAAAMAAAQAALAKAAAESAYHPEVKENQKN